MSTDRLREFYDRRATLYDRIATAPPVRRWRRRAVDALALSAGDAVVEMGCGTGGNLPLLREAVGPGGTVVGVDVARGVLDRARDRVKRNGWTNVHLVHGDGGRAPVDGPVDAVLATFVVGLFEDPATVVGEWCDLVALGGRVALLNAQHADGVPAAVLNPAFDWLVGAVNPGPIAGSGARLDNRVSRARDELASRTVERRYETYAGGFLGLLSGRVGRA